MAIVDGATYAWHGNQKPIKLPIKAIQVGVGQGSYYALDNDETLFRFTNVRETPVPIAEQVKRFFAGESGVLVMTKDTLLWSINPPNKSKRKIARNVETAAVGDGANYYINKAGSLFVKGKAHRGQYGDGKLQSTDWFQKTADKVKQISAHTGHAILLKRNGLVMGTGGNIFGPVGKTGIGDKAIKWSNITSNARSIATGSTHSFAIRNDDVLLAWGRGYKLEPEPIMQNVAGVAAGSRTSIALKKNGTLWQWEPGENPKQLILK